MTEAFGEEKQQNEGKLVKDLTVKELDRLIFKASKSVDNVSFKGYFPYIRELLDENKKINERLDNIELLLKALIKQ
ncbi:hypothetical protein [Virgibacillus sp. CBA3643]|uniref:hypothetical protein n=1 Tax=Virgibacillus sp. CBA3643 TaxID=2942278 RepID=UPI0035A38D27